MQPLDALFQTYLTQIGAAQDQAANDIAAHPDGAAFLLSRLADHPRAALALLARCAKKQAGRAFLANEPVEHLAAFLSDTDAKTRKNAAILLGALDNRAYVPHLIDALERETQQFVRPSIVLALGALGGAKAKKALLDLPIPSDGGKHARAMRDAIQKAGSRLIPAKNRAFTALPKPMELLLAPVSGLMDTLIREGRDKGIPLRHKGGYATIETADYAALFRLRCFYEVLIPIANAVPLNPRAFASMLRERKVYDLLNAMHDGAGPFALRLELKAKGLDRAAFASAFFSQLDGERFINAPSSYDVELRAVQKNGTAALYLRLYTYPDPRFSYRSGAVAASMHPAAAAAILYAHRDRMKPDHTVLDPFCGAGTLLIERAQIMDAARLTGIDISPEACRIARANSKNAGLPIRVYNRDSRGFSNKDRVQEIICNLPFGHRVGSHADNRKLYDDSLSQWKDLLHRDGFVLAITNDKKLFTSLAKRHGFRIVRRSRFSYGGLAPTCYLLQH